MLPALAVPTVTVPATSPCPAVPVPKLMASVVAVVMLPGAVVPVASVFQPGIGPAVGADQVPPAVPKPAPARLSQ